MFKAIKVPGGFLNMTSQGIKIEDDGGGNVVAHWGLDEWAANPQLVFEIVEQVLKSSAMGLDSVKPREYQGIGL